MLYLIFTQRITVGQFFSLFIYSFFIFGPLQELGNVVNTYRETEVSLQNFEGILAMTPEPRPENPVAGDSTGHAGVQRRGIPASDGDSPALAGDLIHGFARGNDRFRRTVGSRVKRLWSNC